ncbi:hypothetical protein BGX24_001167 [Mortierella sp. AD032]|nr:hypothetical protein BGX24_001167 [Mortierella sp. AD032]
MSHDIYHSGKTRTFQSLEKEISKSSAAFYSKPSTPASWSAWSGTRLFFQSSGAPTTYSHGNKRCPTTRRRAIHYCLKSAKNRGTVQRRRELLKAKADINMSLKFQRRLIRQNSGLKVLQWEGDK